MNRDIVDRPRKTISSCLMVERRFHVGLLVCTFEQELSSHPLCIDRLETDPSKYLTSVSGSRYNFSPRRVLHGMPMLQNFLDAEQRKLAERKGSPRQGQNQRRFAGAFHASIADARIRSLSISDFICSSVSVSSILSPEKGYMNDVAGSGRGRACECSSSYTFSVPLL